MARCTAKNSRGERCQRDAIRGGTVCPTHGGRAPQVKAAAEARLRALADPAIGVLEYALKQKTKKLTNALTASKDVLDRSGFKPVEEHRDVTPPLTPEERVQRLRELHAQLFSNRDISETVQ